MITAQTSAPSTDLEAQQEALRVIREAFDQARTDPALTLDVTGVGAFSLELQSTIRAESQLLGILAGASRFPFGSFPGPLGGYTERTRRRKGECRGREQYGDAVHQRITSSRRSAACICTMPSIFEIMT